jgi:hypothetical protein
MRLQSRLPNMEMMDKGFKSHNPIKGANIVQSLNPLQAKMLEKSKTMIVEDPYGEEEGEKQNKKHDNLKAKVAFKQVLADGNKQDKYGALDTPDVD